VAVDGDNAGYDPAWLAPQGWALRVVQGDPPGGKATALNAAVRESEGELLLFADTFQRFEPDAVSRLVAAVSAGVYGAVSGALMLSGPDGRETPLTRYWQAEKRLREAEARLHSAVGVTGAIYAMRRALWQPLPAGVILDDLFVPMRLVLAGHRIGFEAGARATDQRRTTAREELRRKRRTLTGNLQLCAWLPAVLNPARNPIWTAFVCHKLLRLLTPFCLTAIGAGAIGLLAGRPSGAAIAAGSLLLAVLATLGAPGGFGRRLREAVWWGVAMQVATVQAAWRGLRGRWDVWEPSRSP
jgi:cellulose synthase/poly-beta-1,6-N-acetylglucosamine synthase-like glycosyltransferase